VSQFSYDLACDYAECRYAECRYAECRGARENERRKFEKLKTLRKLFFCLKKLKPVIRHESVRKLLATLSLVKHSLIAKLNVLLTIVFGQSQNNLCFT